jgi:hypothetical protein
MLFPLFLACTFDYGLQDMSDAALAIPDGVVRGRICDPAGGYIAGAKILLEVDGELLTTKTDGDGWFDLEGVPDGTHVLTIKKGSFKAFQEVTVTDGRGQLIEEVCFASDAVSILVVTGEYDTVEDVLDRLNLEYTVIDGRVGTAYVDVLADELQLAEYDIVFLNCGVSDAWRSRRDEVGTGLRRYVKAGGNIYASDWAASLVEESFPGAVDFYGDDTLEYESQVGVTSNVPALVLDEDMSAILGSEQATIRYDLDAWVAVRGGGEGTEVLVQGDPRVYDLNTGKESALQNVPLAVSFEREGTVLYTTFHNERQTTMDMDELLREMVLRL